MEGATSRGWKDILVTLSALGLFKESALRILADLGVTKLEPDRWYSQRAYVQFFEILSERTGPSTLYLNGRKVAENVALPRDIDSLEKLFRALNSIYQQGRRHCNPDEGWRYERIDEQSARMTIISPYPDEYERGVLEGFARKYKPPDAAHVRVEYEPSQPRADAGGDRTVFLVTW
jgi:hypothetical protein